MDIIAVLLSVVLAGLTALGWRRERKVNQRLARTIAGQQAEMLTRTFCAATGLRPPRAPRPPRFPGRAGR